MIENINDILTISIIGLLIIICALYTFSVFSKYHARRLMELESEYYDYSDDNIDDDTYL